MREGDPLLLAGRQNLRPVADVIQTDGEVRQGHLDQRLLDLPIIDDAFLVGIRHDGAKIAEGQKRQLRHEHRRLPSGRLNGPERCQRIAPKETTESAAATAQNSSVDPESYFGLLVLPPTPVVKMSMS